MREAIVVVVVISLFIGGAQSLPRTPVPGGVKRPASGGPVPGRPCSPMPLEVLWKKLETTANKQSLDRFRAPVGLPLVPPEPVAAGGGGRGHGIRRQRSPSSGTDHDVIRRSVTVTDGQSPRASVTPPSVKRGSRPRPTPKPKPKRTRDFQLRNLNTSKTREMALVERSNWLCQLETEWKRMEEDVFPPLVETGRCAQSTCMMGLYTCIPRQYAVKVLKRVPDQCNPLPRSAGHPNGTVFEEVWAFSEYHVTVGCECAKRSETGIFTLKPPSPSKPPRERSVA